MPRPLMTLGQQVRGQPDKIVTVQVTSVVDDGLGTTIVSGEPQSGSGSGKQFYVLLNQAAINEIAQHATKGDILEDK